MDELNDQVTALEAALAASSGDEPALEQVLRRGELMTQRLDELAARADRLATRLRARVIATCRERLGATS